ncbi:MAG: hypothetical protein K1X78_26900 [Verrucomicrobiaceae bacterium]|nr:hypothetical protein [Verrucomicrobiaceae bacterium]
MIFPSPKACAACLILALSGWQLYAVDAPLSGEPEGFYPTYMDTGGGMYLGLSNPDVYRSNGYALQPPDLDRWASTGGVWPYEIETGPVAQMHRATNWLDYIFRPLTPGETTVVQDPTGESWFQLGASFPFLSRAAHAEQTHFARIFGDKATQYSPLYFDVLGISFYAIYDDISGPAASNVDDGFASALSIDLRGIFRITHNTSITIHGQVFFVFTEDADVGYYLSAGAPGAFASFNVQEEIGAWDIRIFDNLFPFSPREVFMADTFRGAVDITGHTYVGSPMSIDLGNWWDTRGALLLNTAGFTAGRFLGESLRFLAGFARVDQWAWDNFDQHVPSEYVNVGLFYDAYDWWIAPSVTYQMKTTDFEDPQHMVLLNATAPITSNVSWVGAVGYSFGDEFDGWVWHLGLSYRQTERLFHTFTYSAGYQDTIIGDAYSGDRFAYGLGYNIGPRAQLGLLVDWLDNVEGGGDAFDVGLAFNVALANYTWLRAFTGYQDIDGGEAKHGNPTTHGTTWIYSLSLSQQILTRLHGAITASYAQHDGNAGRYATGYDEYMLMLTLTRYF